MQTAMQTSWSCLSQLSPLALANSELVICIMLQLWFIISLAAVGKPSMASVAFVVPRQSGNTM